MPSYSADISSAKTSEFRAALRAYSLEKSSDVRSMLVQIFEGDVLSVSLHGRIITKDTFSELMNNIRPIRQKFTPNDLNDIYSEALLEFGSEKMNTTNLVEHLSLTISKARSLAMRLRKVVEEDYPGGMADYVRCFESILVSGSSIVDLDALTDFAEEMLDLADGTISDKEAKELYAFVDKNGDGNVNQDDFVEYMLGPGAESVRRMGVSNDDVIVDIQASCTVAQEQDLKKAGYTQVTPDLTGMPGASLATHGSFGNAQSLWIWKTRQGTCSGRLRPVVDIRLENLWMSSDLVLQGYTCLTVPIAGQYVWIKHAMNPEEYKNGIVDLRVTLGKSRSASDKIWLSPGVGWTHAEGNFNKTMFGSADAFLWYRLLRSGGDSSNPAPKTDGIRMTGDARQARLLQAVRTAIRHYVPLSMLATNAKRGNENGAVTATDGAGVSPRGVIAGKLFDFSHLFGMYNANKNTMGMKDWRRILVDVGVPVDRPDENLCYNHMDGDGDGALHRKEFAAFLVYTDFEIDATMDEIRDKLLRHHITNKGKNPLRQSRVLSHIFSHFNTSRDNVLSQAELGAMCAALQIFLVEEEVNKIMKHMDLDKDGRVEEGDFMRFLQAESKAYVRRAHRVHTAASFFRRWLIRGTGDSPPRGSTSLVASQWNELKRSCERVTSKTFPGYLGASDLQNVLAHHDIHLAFKEASELALVIAPHRNARIQQSDLEIFMKSSCRSIGELAAIVERDTMKTVVELYRVHRSAANHDGAVDDALNSKYLDTVKDILTRVMASEQGGASDEWSEVRAASNKAAKSASTEVVSVAQLKAGIEASMGRPPNSPLPNLEEWAVLAVLVGGAVAEQDVFGVNCRKFVQGVCVHSVGQMGTLGPDETVSLDVLCDQLRSMIKDEALCSGNNKTYDYVSVFHTFDSDGGGTISLQEFSDMLVRLQLVDRLPKSQIPALLKMFDTSNKGSISFEDFLRFVESGRGDDDDDMALDDDDQDDALIPSIGSNTAPTKITGNDDCDWLLWFLWRQCCRTSHRDPEAPITDLEVACGALAKEGSSGNEDYRGISADSLWHLIGEHRLCGNMTRSQFESGVHFVCLDGYGRSTDPVDYLSLCRYVIRMGRAYNGMVQERRNVDGRKFAGLFASLQKQLIVMDTTRSIDTGMIGASVTEAAGTSGSYFERVLRRQDTNSDGLLTLPEFKLGLRRMQIHDERQWNKAMVRKLFEETDNRSDGLLSIAEFGRVVRGDYSRDAEARDAELSDDEDDRIFSAQRNTPDWELQKKVGAILMDLVPLIGQTGSPNAISTHCDAVRQAIYRFFQRFDPESNGLIAEEHFHVFARKSGLQSRLKGGELRRLISKIRVRGLGRESASVDYEKLCKMVSPNSDSVPRARVDGIMMRLQEAAKTSARADRSFMNLCTLADPRMTGFISNDELMIVSKMMGCALTQAELHMVLELQTDDKQSPSRGPAPVKSAVDYKRFNHMLMTFSPGAAASINTFSSESKDDVYRMRAHDGALPAYATPSGVTRVPPSPHATVSLEQMRGLNATGGFYLTTPVRASTQQMSSSGQLTSYGPSVRMSTMGGYDQRRTPMHGQGGDVTDRVINALAKRVAEAGMGQGSAAISAFLRRCEEADGQNSGYLSEAAMQSVCDDCRVLLTPSDLYSIRRRFAATDGDGRIDYMEFCQALHLEQELDRDNVRSRGYVGFRDILQSPAISRRLRSIRFEGTDVRRMFEDADIDGSGTVDARRFSDVLMRLGIVQTERQLNVAIDEFACLSNRSRVNYVEFCVAVEKAENMRRSVDGDAMRMSGGMPSSGFRSHASTPFNHTAPSPMSRSTMGSGYDGLLSRSHNPVTAARTSLAWEDQLSDRTELDSLTSTGTGSHLKVPRGGIAMGRNVATTSTGAPAMWSCAVCAHDENSFNDMNCEVCDTPRSAKDADERVCLNCKYANRSTARTCKMCDLQL